MKGKYEPHESYKIGVRADAAGKEGRKGILLRSHMITWKTYRKSASG